MPLWFSTNSQDQTATFLFMLHVAALIPKHNHWRQQRPNLRCSIVRPHLFSPPALFLYQYLCPPPRGGCPFRLLPPGECWWCCGRPKTSSQVRSIDRRELAERLENTQEQMGKLGWGTARPLSRLAPAPVHWPEYTLVYILVAMIHDIFFSKRKSRRKKIHLGKYVRIELK